jgi:hypothetical protein
MSYKITIKGVDRSEVNDIIKKIDELEFKYSENPYNTVHNKDNQFYLNIELENSDRNEVQVPTCPTEFVPKFSTPITSTATIGYTKDPEVEKLNSKIDELESKLKHAFEFLENKLNKDLGSIVESMKEINDKTNEKIDLISDSIKSLPVNQIIYYPTYPAQQYPYNPNVYPNITCDTKVKATGIQRGY